MQCLCASNFTGCLTTLPEHNNAITAIFSVRTLSRKRVVRVSNTPATTFGSSPSLAPTRTRVMRKEKFETNFVKPLYKVKIKPKVFTNIDRLNLVGDVCKVNVNETYSSVKFKDVKKYKLLPGGCEESQSCDLQCGRNDSVRKIFQREVKKTVIMGDKKSVSDSRNEDESKNEVIINKNRDTINLSSPVTWLRVYPAHVVPGEAVPVVVMRCVACQLGLTACLVLWTFLWVFVLHSFEAPHEIEITENFIKEQHQLVIDLATELRQITPISPKWREAITHRIEEGRMQTMIAAGKGVKLEPGWYWDLAGTFLFSIYVMTALGFGAPVPQTMYGRCMSLLFAVFAVPTHVYLMVNASTCTIAQIDRGLKQWQKHLSTPILENGDGRSIRNKDSPSSSVNSDVKTWRRARLWRLVSVLTFGHCVPLACTLYYFLGALIFGLPRQTSPIDIVLFPLQFTTGGGLATVEFHYRILYGFYVEGAMALLHCALATIRRSSSKPVYDMTVKYRLFSTDECGQ